MTLFLNLYGFGFFWQIWDYDLARDERVVFRLRLHAGAGSIVKREWAVSLVDDLGFRYTEHSPRRDGSWILRGPWQKVA